MFIVIDPNETASGAFAYRFQKHSDGSQRMLSGIKKGLAIKTPSHGKSGPLGNLQVVSRLSRNSRHNIRELG